VALPQSCIKMAPGRAWRHVVVQQQCLRRAAACAACGLAVAWTSLAFVGPTQSSTSGHSVATLQADRLAARVLRAPRSAAEAASFQVPPRPATFTWVPLACTTLLVACVAGQSRALCHGQGKRPSRACQVVACRSSLPSTPEQEPLPQPRCAGLAAAPAPELPPVASPACTPAPATGRPEQLWPQCSVALPSVQPAAVHQPAAAPLAAATAPPTPSPRSFMRGSQAPFVGGARRSSSHRAHQSRAGGASARAACADRRKVGARLRPALDFPVMEASFDPSQLRTKLQVGALHANICRCTERPREFQTPSTAHGLSNQTEVHLYKNGKASES